MKTRCIKAALCYFGRLPGGTIWWAVQANVKSFQMGWVPFPGTCNLEMLLWIFPKITSSLFFPKKPPIGFLLSVRRGNSLPSRKCLSEDPGCQVETGEALGTIQNKMANSMDFAYVHVLYLSTFWSLRTPWPPFGPLLTCPITCCNSFRCVLSACLYCCLDPSLICSSNAVEWALSLRGHLLLSRSRTTGSEDSWRPFLVSTFSSLRGSVANRCSSSEGDSFYH